MWSWIHLTAGMALRFPRVGNRGPAVDQNAVQVDTGEFKILYFFNRCTRPVENQQLAVAGQLIEIAQVTGQVRQVAINIPLDLPPTKLAKPRS